MNAIIVYLITGTLQGAACTLPAPLAQVEADYPGVVARYSTRAKKPPGIDGPIILKEGEAGYNLALHSKCLACQSRHPVIYRDNSGR